jgi:hypothetical protein
MKSIGQEGIELPLDGENMVIMYVLREERYILSTIRRLS